MSERIGGNRISMHTHPNCNVDLLRPIFDDDTSGIDVIRLLGHWDRIIINVNPNSL